MKRDIDYPEPSEDVDKDVSDEDLDALGLEDEPVDDLEEERLHELDE